MRVAMMLFLAVLAAPSSVRAQGTPDGAALAAAYADAFNAKDAAKLAALFAEDAVLMPSDRPLVKGRTAIEAAFKALFANPIGRLDIQIMDSDVQGARATFVGTFTLRTGNPSGLTMMGVGGGGTTTPGKYLIIYKRVNNQWLVAYNISNYDAPQAPPPPVAK